MLKVVVSAFAPVMKAAGYKKQASRFREDVSPNVTRLVNIQSSMWNDDGKGKFTVNLGVYHRELAILFGESPIESPLVQHCAIQERIGSLMPGGTDHWWSFNRKTDLVALGNEVGSIWEQYAKPWIDSHSTWDGVRDHFLASNNVFLAAKVCFAAGDLDESRQLLDKALNECPEESEEILAWRTIYLQ